MKTKSFKELIVWQRAKELAIEVYKLTSKFPKSELFGLTNQMRRASISISSNIAESYHRFHSKEKKQFLAVAFGSGAELESQIEIAKSLFPNLDYSKVETLLADIMKILNKIINKK
ncbi:hypothetical protein HRbin35_00060 [bacterium HR35]|nr:hypothetical protein HRbin35_00060 [bacterium HR35]